MFSAYKYAETDIFARLFYVCFVSFPPWTHIHLDAYSATLLLLFFQIEASGGEAITFGGDVSKEADVESMMKAVSVVCVLCIQKENIPLLFYINLHLDMVIISV
jgi:hypothetical protein